MVGIMCDMNLDFVHLVVTKGKHQVLCVHLVKVCTVSDEFVVFYDSTLYIGLGYAFIDWVSR